MIRVLHMYSPSPLLLRSQLSLRSSKLDHLLVLSTPCLFQTEPALVPYKACFHEALKEVGVIPDLQAIIWGYFERKPFTFGSAENGELASPGGVSVDKNGLVYVSDTSHNRVQIFSEDGKWIQTLLSPDRDSPGFFNGPVGITVGPDGSIYICGNGNHAVVVYNSDGKFLRQIGSDQLSRVPRDVAVSPDGSLVYVTDIKRSNYLSVFTSDGQFSHYIGDESPILHSLAGVAVGPDGNIYVSDDTDNCVQVYTPSGQHVRQLGQTASSSDAQGTRNPWGVAVSPEGLVYVTDRTHHRVQVFNSTGTFLYAVPVPRPFGLAVSSNGMVYVSSREKDVIHAFPAY